MTAAAASAPASTEWKNLFGVCACLGEDFGFNPLFLRVSIAVALMWNPLVVIAVYATLGVAVLVSRLAVPNRRDVSGAAAELVPAPGPAALAEAAAPELARAA